MKLRTLFVLAIFCLMSTAVFAQGPAGKWTGESQGARGAQAVTLDLKVAGTALTGTITLNQGMPFDITDGKIEGNKFTFKVAGGGGRGGPAGGGRRGAVATYTYTGTINGNEMNVTRETQAPAGGAAGGGAAAGGGGRDGAAAQPVTFTLKRS